MVKKWVLLLLLVVVNVVVVVGDFTILNILESQSEILTYIIFCTNHT